MVLLPWTEEVKPACARAILQWMPETETSIARSSGARNAGLFAPITGQSQPAMFQRDGQLIAARVLVGQLLAKTRGDAIDEAILSLLVGPRFVQDRPDSFPKEVELLLERGQM